MEKFTVTIARGFGSGGRTIGKMLADKLGVKFYDKELIRMASDASGINEALFGQSDEKTKNSIFGKPGVYKGEVIAPEKSGFISEENLFNYQAMAGGFGAAAAVEIARHDQGGVSRGRSRHVRERGGAYRDLLCLR